MSSYYDHEAIKRIKKDLFYNGIPGTNIKGFTLEMYGDLVFTKIKTWKRLDKEEKYIILRYRQLLIKGELTKEEKEEFISLAEKSDSKELDLIEWPVEYYSFEPFIINLIMEKEFTDGNKTSRENEAKTEKRVVNRRRNSIFS